jgi:hypothetical protein
LTSPPCDRDLDGDERGDHRQAEHVIEADGAGESDLLESVEFNA